MRQVIVFCLIIFCVTSTSAWWRRRRRRCDSSSCQWKWSSCSRSCGGGVQSPIITKKQGSCGSCNLPKQRHCNTQCCRVDCKWGSWTQFQPCSRTCGSGVQHRGRKIVVQASCGGSHCVGSASESRKCNTNCCPQDCKWGNWAGLTPCTKSCGTGTQIAHRKKEVTESCGGKSCTGSTTKIIKCNTKCCPVDCSWGLWGAFGSCSVSCGGGLQTRKRKISLPAKCGGVPCSGESQEIRKCSLQCCPDNCKWGSWGKFSSCSASCGGGLQSRSRKVAVPNSCGGASCVGSAIDKRSCGEKCCPVDCVWGEWSKFDICTATCGTGKQTRVRSVAKPQLCNGRPCSGKSKETRTCNQHCCPVDCQLRSWSDWSHCSSTCGPSGVSVRMRSIKVYPKCGGKTCDKGLKQTRSCLQHCLHGGTLLNGTCSCGMGWSGDCCQTNTSADKRSSP